MVLVEAAVGATTTVVIHGKRANRVGSFWNTMCPVDVGHDVPRRLRTANRGYLCLEDGQRLQNARRNKHGNRDKGTRQRAGINEGRRSLWKKTWMRWPNCANMLQHRRRYSTLMWKKTETDEGVHVGA